MNVISGGQCEITWEWSQYWQPRLAGEECDLTVVVCHDTVEALTELASQTTGIDLLVGGCGVALTDTLTNAAGEEVPLVSGGGSALTRTVVTLDEDGVPVVGESELLSLSQYENDMELAGQMAPYLAQYEEQAQQYVGRLSGQWGGESSYSTQSVSADLVGEAMLWATQADAALIRPSELALDQLAQRFQRVTTSASITKADCITLVSDPAPVVVVELTGTQLRQWLEGSAQRYQVSETTGAVYGGEGADVLYGMDYEIYLGNDAGQRVTGLTFQGQPVQDNQVFRIAVSARRLDEEEFPVHTAVWSAAAQGDLAAQGGSAAVMVAAYAADATARYGALTPERSSTWEVYTGAYGEELTRLEFITMLYQYAGSPQPGADAAFIDVVGNDAVVWAAETGIVSGNGKGYFYPNQILTREQAAVMLYNYARSQGVESTNGVSSLSGFLDAGEIADWAAPAVAFCTQAGVIQGGGTRGDLFQPQSGLTRREADWALERFFSYLGE